MLQIVRKQPLTRNDNLSGVKIALVPEFGWCETSDNVNWLCFITPTLNGIKAELMLNFDELPEKQQLAAWPRLNSCLISKPTT